MPSFYLSLIMSQQNFAGCSIPRMSACRLNCVSLYCDLLRIQKAVEVRQLASSQYRDIQKLAVTLLGHPVNLLAHIKATSSIHDIEWPPIHDKGAQTLICASGSQGNGPD
jgi:hypothetical protein